MRLLTALKILLITAPLVIVFTWVKILNDMKEVTTSNGKFLFVEVPEGWNSTAGSTMSLFEKVYHSGVVDIKADLEHYATTQKLTESDCEGIVGKRIIYISPKIAYPVNEQCCHYGCIHTATGKHWAMMHEGHYVTDEVIGAGMPVCSLHSKETINAYWDLVNAHNLTATNYAILKVL